MDEPGAGPRSALLILLGTLTHAAEYDLLLDAIVPRERARADPAAFETSSWGRVLSAADWHRLSPLLYTHLNDGGEPGAGVGAPAAVLVALERAYLASSARSLFIRAALERALETLARTGVSAMLLKGAALVETVYPDPAHREMLDIDLLVAPERVSDATDALRKIGFDSVSEAMSEPVQARSVTTARHHDEALVNRDQLVAIELHRHIAIEGEEWASGLSDFWERALTNPVTGHLVPAPEDLLIHLCLHFTRNRLGGSARRRNSGGALGQLCDIARVVEREQVDWASLAATARRHGVGSRVFLALFVARELGVRVPLPALARLEPRGFDPAIGRRLVELRVLRGGDHLPVRSTRWMFAPSKEALRRGWNADPNATLSLARAYMRRARAHVPEARSALRRPWIYVQDQRLNDQLDALEQRP
jgi:hypothetical protein